MDELLDDLTPSQREAVTHKDGPLLVVAGAGSGKTRVITRRVAHLVRLGVAPRNVLAITFTNKAAGEMRARVERLLPRSAATEAGGVATVSTFHSLCARLLRRWAPKVGFERSFAILDDGDQRAAIRESLLEVAADPKLFPPPKVAHAIGRAKDRLESPAELLRRAASRMETVVAKTFAVYQGLLQQRNALDFDDLLIKTVELVQKHEDARAALLDRFRYVLIDEYQDTNHAQYQLARALSAHGNLNATGDPDQSIYGWRGADVENILRFEKDFPGARVVLLETNFRSTSTVCNVANALIRHNKRRKEKVLRTDNEEGVPLELHESADEASEARHVAQRIEALVQAGTPAGSIAVFYRTNSLSRGVEQALFERRIPYVVVGALSFYERKEVKDVLAYLRLLANPKDDASAQRVFNTPPRGIGKTSLERLKAFAQAQGLSLAAAIGVVDAVPDLPKKARAGLRDVAGILGRLRGRLEEASAEALVRAVVEETNYLAYLAQEYPEEEDRGSNVEALVAGAREFDARARDEVARRALVSDRAPARPRPGTGDPAAARPGTAERRAVAPQIEKPAPSVSRGKRKAARANPQQPSLFAEPEESPVPASATPSPASVAPESVAPATVAPSDPAAGFEDDVLPELAPGLEGYLEQIALLAAQDQAKDEDVREKVSLMTVHTAKGLEFDAVFVIGLEEGLFPNGRALDESVEGLEEERRLAYVALTRARKRLFLSHASARSRFGRTDYRPPSPFLFELPEQAFEAGKAPRDLTPHGVPASTLRWDPDDDGLDDQGYPVEEGSARRPGRRARPDGAPWDDADPEGPDPTAPADGERARPVEAEAADLPEFDSSPLWSRRVSGAREAARGAGRAASSAQRSPEAAPPRPAPVQSPAGALDLEAGDRVRHEHFGLGEVVTVAGSGIAKRAKIRFLEFGEKNLVVQYARLVKVPR